MLADQAKVRKGGSDVGTEHSDTGAPPLRPGLEPSSQLVSPLHTYKGLHRGPTRALPAVCSLH